MRIDIERLIDVITEENNAYGEYATRAHNKYRNLPNDYEARTIELDKRQGAIEYSYHYSEKQQTATWAVCEVFGLHKEELQRLHIAARAVNRWRNATNWERLIPDTMKQQIAEFIFGCPEHYPWQLKYNESFKENYANNYVGPFEIA